MSLPSPAQSLFSSPPTQSRRYRKPKPTVRLLVKPAVMAPKRLFKKLRSYVIPKQPYDISSPAASKGMLFRNSSSRYAEKCLYGDSYDYTDEDDDDDEEEDADGFVFVDQDKGQSKRYANGEKRAGVGAWEIESRSMVV